MYNNLSSVSYANNANLAANNNSSINDWATLVLYNVELNLADQITKSQD